MGRVDRPLEGLGDDLPFTTAFDFPPFRRGSFCFSPPKSNLVIFDRISWWCATLRWCFPENPCAASLQNEAMETGLSGKRAPRPPLSHVGFQLTEVKKSREHLGLEFIRSIQFTNPMKIISSFVLLSATVLVAETTFSPWSFTEKDLFPSAIISTATVDWNGDEELAENKKTEGDPELEAEDIPIYGDENGWLAVDLGGISEGAKVEVEISVDGYMKPSKWKGTIGKTSEDGEARVFPKGLWDYPALMKVRQQRPVNATFKVKVNGKTLDEETEICTMRSINDCAFYILWEEDGEEFDDFSWLFAAYVNENHPWVDGILKEALDSGLVSSFTGYQSEDPEEVIAQVFAVWNVLQRRGIKYSDVSTTTPSKFVFSQNVRFLDQTVKSTQANCVDGSVLMASVLRKIGINPYLVMVPGHCFLAFDSGDGEDSEIIGLETTMIGNAQLKPLKVFSGLSEKGKLRELKISYESFIEAIDAGNGQIEEHSDELDSEEYPDIQLISISDARELGIMPIAFDEIEQ